MNTADADRVADHGRRSLAVLIAFFIRQMLRGWLHRAQRQVELIGTLPPLPDTVGPGDHPGHQGPLRRQHDRAELAGPDRRRRPGLPQQGGADPLPRGNHAAAQRRRPDLDSRRVDHGDPHRTRHRGQGADPRRASSRSAGGCRRAPRSTPGSAATTAANSRNWAREEDVRMAVETARPYWFSTTDGSSPARRSARSVRRSARRCSPPGCPATRRR